MSFNTIQDLDFSPENRKEDIFYQAEVAEKLALSKGQILPTTVRSLPIPEIKIHKENKNKPNKTDSVESMDYIPNKSTSKSDIPLCCNKIYSETSTQTSSDNRQCDITKNEDK